MPPEIPSTTSSNPFFVDVVGEAELEREPHLLELAEERLERRCRELPFPGRGRRQLDHRRVGTPPPLPRQRPASRVPQPVADRGRGVDIDDEQRLLEGGRRARRPRPSWSSTSEWPSKTSSSCPPTAFTNATQHTLSRARTASISLPLRPLPT